MRFSDLIRHLENDTHLPIEPSRIVGILREGAAIDQVQFIGVKWNTGILRGKFVRAIYGSDPLPAISAPYAQSEGLVAKVYYAVNQEPDYIRLVINKELLHLTDPVVARTASRDKVVALASRLRVPTELIIAAQQRSHHDIDALIDYLGDYRAVIAMVPQRLRDLICEKHVEKKIGEAEIASLTGVPLKYVSLIVSDLWTSLRDTWLQLPD